MVQNSSLSGRIDTVICGDEIKHRKPDRRALDSLEQSFDPNEVLVIGDQHVDAEFALNLNGSAILANRTAGDIAHLNRVGSESRRFVDVVTTLTGVSI